jgi:hypothetical protein
LPLAVAALAFLHGAFYVVAIPPWDLYDEEQHLDVALAIRDERRLPHLDDELRPGIVTDIIASDRWKRLKIGRPDTTNVVTLGMEGRSYEAYQPPLYYLLVAPITAPAGDDARLALWLARGVGPFLLVALVAVTWQLGARWFPGAGSLAPGASALTVAAVPAAAQAAGRVSNDLLAAVLVCAGVLALSTLLERPRLPLACLAGGLAAAAILTKSHGAILIGVIVVALLLLWRRHRLTLGIAAASLAPPIAALAGWSAWNLSRYGTLDGSTAYLERYQTYQPLPWNLFLRTFWLNAWSDYWGAYGGAGRLQTTTNLLLITVGGVGIGLFAAHRRATTPVILTAAVAAALLAGLILANDTAIVRPAGRMLLPLYSLLAILAVSGWASLKPRLAFVVPAATSALSIIYLTAWFVPFFH